MSKFMLLVSHGIYLPQQKAIHTGLFYSLFEEETRVEGWCFAKVQPKHWEKVVENQLFFTRPEEDGDDFGGYKRPREGRKFYKAYLPDPREQELTAKQYVASLFGLRYMLRFLGVNFRPFYTPDLVLTVGTYDPDQARQMCRYLELGTSELNRRADGSYTIEATSPASKGKKKPPKLESLFGGGKKKDEEPEDTTFLHPSVWLAERQAMTEFPVRNFCSLSSGLEEIMHTKTCVAINKPSPIPTWEALSAQFNQAKRKRTEDFLDQVGGRHRQRPRPPKR